MKIEDMPLIDLFCGCGGFSLGAKLAGFQTRLAIDIDSTLQSAYRLNFPQTHAVQSDISLLDPSALKKTFKIREVGAIIGGPPCQGFSRIGRRNMQDPRNTLVYHFYRHVKYLMPKFFLMENVQGILDRCNIEILEDAISTVANEYSIIGPLTINAVDYGAPTKRKRIIVFGYKKNFFGEIKSNFFYPKECAITVTVKDAISDLPIPIQSVKKKVFEWSQYKKNSKLSVYAKSMREHPPAGLGLPEFICKQIAGYVSGMEATEHSEAIRDRYRQLTPGTTDKISRSYKLDWEGQCPTIRAGTGSDKGSFQAVRPIHPEEGRVITVREAARLQGFPDWFVFHPTKWHSFRMIGNSVSPVFAKELFLRIRSLF